MENEVTCDPLSVGLVVQKPSANVGPSNRSSKFYDFQEPESPEEGTVKSDGEHEGMHKLVTCPSKKNKLATQLSKNVSSSSNVSEQLVLASSSKRFQAQNLQSPMLQPNISPKQQLPARSDSPPLLLKSLVSVSSKKFQTESESIAQDPSDVLTSSSKRFQAQSPHQFLLKQPTMSPKQRPLALSDSPPLLVKPLVSVTSDLSIGQDRLNMIQAVPTSPVLLFPSSKTPSVSKLSSFMKRFLNDSDLYLENSADLIQAAPESPSSIAAMAVEMSGVEIFPTDTQKSKIFSHESTRLDDPPSDLFQQRQEVQSAPSSAGVEVFGLHSASINGSLGVAASTLVEGRVNLDMSSQGVIESLLPDFSSGRLPDIDLPKIPILKQFSNSCESNAY